MIIWHPDFLSRLTGAVRLRCTGSPRACSFWIDRKASMDGWISLAVNYKCANCANLMTIKPYTCVFSISSILDVFAKIALFSTLMFRLRWHRHSWRMQLKYHPSLGADSVPGQKHFFADHPLGFKKPLRRSSGRYHEVLGHCQIKRPTSLSF